MIRKYLLYIFPQIIAGAVGVSLVFSWEVRTMRQETEIEFLRLRIDVATLRLQLSMMNDHDDAMRGIIRGLEQPRRIIGPIQWPKTDDLPDVGKPMLQEVLRSERR